MSNDINEEDINFYTNMLLRNSKDFDKDIAKTIIRGCFRASRINYLLEKSAKSIRELKKIKELQS
jgi:hypothetical protein